MLRATLITGAAFGLLTAGTAAAQDFGWNVVQHEGPRKQITLLHGTDAFAPSPHVTVCVPVYVNPCESGLGDLLRKGNYDDSMGKECRTNFKNPGSITVFYKRTGSDKDRYYNVDSGMCRVFARADHLEVSVKKGDQGPVAFQINTAGD
jgi:hypothetical protein